jgi:hypothetical protein
LGGERKWYLTVAQCPAADALACHIHLEKTIGIRVRWISEISKWVVPSCKEREREERERERKRERERNR